VLLREDVVPLYERDSGAAAPLYTTRAVRKEEGVALGDAAAIAERYGKELPLAALRAVNDERGLAPEQQRAFVHATGGGGLALIEGRADIGKRHTPAACPPPGARRPRPHGPRGTPAAARTGSAPCPAAQTATAGGLGVGAVSGWSRGPPGLADRSRRADTSEGVAIAHQHITCNA